MFSTNFLTRNMYGNSLTGSYMNSFSGLGSCGNIFGSIFNCGNSYDAYQGAVIGNTVASIIGLGLTACFAGKVGAKSSGTSTESGQVENDSNLSTKEQLDNVKDKINEELSNIGNVNENNYNNYDIKSEENYINLQNDLNAKTKAVTDLTRNGDTLKSDLVGLRNNLKNLETNNTDGKNNAQIANLKQQIAEKQVEIEYNENELKKAKEEETKAQKDLDAHVEKRTDEVKTAQKNIKNLIQKRNTLKIKAEKEDNDATLKDLRKTAAEFVKAKATNPQDKAKIRQLAQYLANLDIGGINTSKSDDKYLQVRESAKKWLEENPEA